MTTQEILLLCPCCGHRAELKTESNEYGQMYSVECENCGLGFEAGISADVIVNAWNARRTDGLERWIDGEIAKGCSYYREQALRECHVQLKKLLNGLGL